MNVTCKSLLLTCFWLLACLCLQAQTPDLSLPLPLDANVKTGKLPNGLTYYIRKNAKPEKRVELRLVVNAGSILEDEDQQGLAHFNEHMAFNGTKHFPKNELVNYLESIGLQFGADLNAYTSFDETVYILPVPTDKPGLVDKGLQILEDWAHNVTFEGVEIDKERGVVREEWRLGQGANQRMRDKTFPVTFKGSLYAMRLPIGKRNIIDSAKYEALKRFYKDWYRPDLQAVIAVGDIDVNEMEAKIKKYFAAIPLPKNPRERKYFPVPDHAETLVAIASDKEAPFTNVSLLYKKDVEPDKTAGDYARLLTYQVYTGMLNQRLSDLRLKAEPPFIGAGAFYSNPYLRTKGGLSLSATVSETGVEKGLRTLLEENKRVKEFGFTEAELERYKKQMLSNYEREYNERDKTESESYVSEYVDNYLEHAPSPGIEWEYDFVKKYLPTLKVTNINAVAAKLLTDKNLVVTITAPAKEGVKVPTEAEIRAILKDAANLTVKPLEEKVLATSFLDPQSLKPGTITKETKNDKLGTTELVLSNGVRVILKPTDFKNDEVLMQGYSLGGQSLAPDADYYSAAYASQIVSQAGIKDFPMADMSKMLAGKNTRVSPGIGQLTEGIQGSTTPKDLETLLQLTYLYFTAPRHDKEAYTSFATKQKQQFQNLASNPQFYFFGEQNKILTQNHPRAGGLPKPEDFDKIDYEKAFQFYQSRFADASDFTFLLVGTFKTEEIKPLLERYLGSLPATGRKETWKDLGIRPPAGKVEKVINRGTDPKSQVSITFTGAAPYNADDNYALNALGQILSIKLIEKLREEKGGVYGAGASGSMSKYPYESYTFSINFPCGPDNAEALSKDALAELEKIRQQGITPEDVAKIKEQEKRETEVNIKQNRYWLTALQKADFEKINPEKILDWQKRIDSLTSDMLKNVANKYLKPDSYIKIVLMPEEKK